MKKSIPSITIFLLITFSGINLMAIEKTRVTGTIQAVEINEKGEPISVLLETEDDGILVDSSGKGPELLKLVGKRVILTGIISRDQERQATITVKEYQLVEEDKNK